MTMGAAKRNDSVTWLISIRGRYLRPNSHGRTRPEQAELINIAKISPRRPSCNTIKATATAAASTTDEPICTVTNAWTRPSRRSHSGPIDAKKLVDASATLNHRYGIVGVAGDSNFQIRSPQK